MKKIEFENYILYGGFENAERNVLIIYPEKYNMNMVEKNYSKIIKVIRISLGDEEKEDIYLKAAVEGFRECYPPEHPKRIAAEQRLKERQGE